MSNGEDMKRLGNTYFRRPYNQEVHLSDLGLILVKCLPFKDFLPVMPLYFYIIYLTFIKAVPMYSVYRKMCIAFVLLENNNETC